MNLPVYFWIYYFILIIDVFIGIGVIQKFDKAGRIVVFLVFATFVSESLGIGLLKYEELHSVRLTKNPIYHAYNIVEAIVISLYFFNTLRPAKHKLFLTSILIGWPVVGFLNFFFLQRNAINSNFLILENFVVIAMSLYALYSILIDDNVNRVLQDFNFYSWFLLLFLSSTTFFFWSFFDILILQYNKYENMVLGIQGWINVAVYFGFGLVFLFSNKKV